MRQDFDPVRSEALRCACGCIPGHRLCPEAVRLWGAVRMLYDVSAAANYSPKTWAAYEQARKEYDAHMRQRKGWEDLPNE